MYLQAQPLIDPVQAHDLFFLLCEPSALSSCDCESVIFSNELSTSNVGASKLESLLQPSGSVPAPPPVPSFRA